MQFNGNGTIECLRFLRTLNALNNIILHVQNNYQNNCFQGR